MKRAFVWIAFLAAAWPLASAAQAPDSPPPPLERARDQVIAFLQLSDAQAADWDVVFENHRIVADGLRAAIADIDSELRALFDAGSPEPEAVGALAIDRHDLHGELAATHQHYLEAFEALLDEGQLGRLEFVRRADRAQRIIPAFKLFALIPPPPPPTG